MTDQPRVALAGNAKVEVRGGVRLGLRRELTQGIPMATAAEFFFSSTTPTDGSVLSVDTAGPPRSAGGPPVQRLRHALTEMPGEYRIEDDGLTCSYGIFGAPRSGKTFFLLRLLRQLFALWPDQPDVRYGGLILDPKAVLIDDVKAAMEAAGRSDDLIVINNEELLAYDKWVNVIDTSLDPTELGRVLVLAAQSAGTEASEPFWFGTWSNLFSASLQLLDAAAEEIVTLQLLLDTVLSVDAVGADGRPERRIQQLARTVRAALASYPTERQGDLRLAANQIDAFYRQKPDNVATVETLITRAYGGFQQYRWRRYSPHRMRVLGEARSTFFDEIIDDGKVVLVAVSPADPAMSKVLCTLVKCLFQQSVLSRLPRVRANLLRNFTRPIVLACDEYSDVASEVPGQPMGDGYFFSLAAQNGCMGLIATQSVNMLQASSLKENWKAVFSNFGAKIFMRLADNETAEEAQKLAGETEWYVGSSGLSQSKEGISASRNTEMRDRKTLPTAVLTQVIRRGEAVVVGSLDGGVTDPTTMFLYIPSQ